MDERLRFVARLLDGEKMTAVCREFGILNIAAVYFANQPR